MQSLEKIYYESQDGFGPEDFYALFRYLNRLFQSVGPTETLAQALRDDTSLSEADRVRAARAAAHQARRTGSRDDELASIDLERLSHETRYLMKHLLIDMRRFDAALERFPNLAGLEDVPALPKPLFLDARPSLQNEYLTRVGIYL